MLPNNDDIMVLSVDDIMNENNLSMTIVEKDDNKEKNKDASKKEI
jgi:hypothetical protein